MVNKFKTGKKYTYVGSTYIYECLFVSDKTAVLKNLKNKNEFSINSIENAYWKEYKEPIKKTWYADVILDPTDEKISLTHIRSKREDVFPWKKYKLLDTIEINWTQKEIFSCL